MIYAELINPMPVVTKLKAPLIVPGLLHQYSEIKIQLDDDVRFFECHQ